jgi:hypothetical protein
MIASNILINHNGKIVVFLYPTPNCLKQSFFSSYINDGLHFTIRAYKQMYTAIIINKIFTSNNYISI